VFAGLFGVLLPFIGRHRLPLWPWIVGFGLSVPALLRPQLLHYIFVGWRHLGRALGWVNSRILLSAIFYLVIVPMGLCMRLLGKDPMAREFDPDARSYRVRSAIRSVKDMEKPY